jgi:PPOX class probable F420-dependent enzyme
MSDDVTLDEIRTFATELSPWAHLATVGADGAPDVVPVHPAWEGDTLWAMVGSESVKARNVAANPHVALHWQVTEKGDGVEVWGTASVHTDVDTKRRLWNGVFDYNLDDFAQGGPENSPGTAFIQVVPDRALILIAYGMGGSKRWKAPPTT